jgi:hypothetical protein
LIMQDAERFAALSKDDLKAVADYYAVDTDGTKKEIAERMVDEGVTWDDYKRASRVDKTAPQVEAAGEEKQEEVVPASASVPELRQGQPAPQNPNDVAPPGVVTTKDLTPESVAAEAEFVKTSPAPAYHEGGVVEKNTPQTVSFWHPGGMITLEPGQYTITREASPNGRDVFKNMMQHAAPVKPKVAGPDDRVLVKMERQNPTYSIEGITFGVKSPFAVVPSEKARRILKKPGFREATASEAEAFFNG